MSASQLVYIDTNVFAILLLPHPQSQDPYIRKANDFIQDIEAGKYIGVTSTLTEIEYRGVGIRNALGIRSKNWNQFFIALLAISYFTYRMRERVLKDEMGLDEYLNRLNEEYKISDDTTLVLFHLGREKKEIHYFSK